MKTLLIKSASLKFTPKEKEKTSFKSLIKVPDSPPKLKKQFSCLIENNNTLTLKVPAKRPAAVTPSKKNKKKRKKKKYSVAGEDKASAALLSLNIDNVTFLDETNKTGPDILKNCYEIDLAIEDISVL